MTIDEAIKELRNANILEIEQYEQIAEWLEELKCLRKCVKSKAFVDGYEKGRKDTIESAYYVIKPLISLEEWTSRVNYQLQLGLKEQRE